MAIKNGATTNHEIELMLANPVILCTFVVAILDYSLIDTGHVIDTEIETLEEFHETPYNCILDSGY